MPLGALWTPGIGELLVVAALLVIFVFPTIAVLAPALWKRLWGKKDR
ncbi:MAG: hypothetical protein QGH45_17990 [Myxococcota bacterium]|jgi:hypothetical protein|nr:hypothetical protein [Myxococcota bacterium]